MVVPVIDPMPKAQSLELTIGGGGGREGWNSGYRLGTYQMSKGDPTAYFFSAGNPCLPISSFSSCVARSLGTTEFVHAIATTPQMS